MTPLEVRQHLLPIAKLRGYDRAATDSFLKRVGTDYEAVWAERDGLKKRLAHLESELAASRERETAATQTLIWQRRARRRPGPRLASAPAP